MNTLTQTLADWQPTTLDSTPWHLAGWTMVYFLAAGTVAALAGALLRLVCRRAAPELRYGISLATLATLALLPLGIVGWLASGMPTEAVILQESSIEFGYGKSNIDSHIAPPSGRGSTLSKASEPLTSSSRPEGGAIYEADMEAVLIEANTEFNFRVLLAWLPWVWILGAPVTFLLLATGLVGSVRLRRRCKPIVSGVIYETCERLRSSLHVTRHVSVAVCDRIAQPVLVGIVRPLVLLPSAALTGWSPEELEMVLLHELAHVRRWDNLVNLWQRTVESVLFFHPAVWLISRQVRLDREQCCDAVVVAQTAQPQAYAELLLNIAEVHGKSSTLATASALADHPLAGRIRRILNLEEESMLVSRGTLGGFTLVVATLVAVMLWQPVETSVAEEELTTEVAESAEEKGLTTENKDGTEEEELNAESEESAKEEVPVDKVYEPGKTMVRFLPHPTSSKVVEEEVKKLNRIGHNVTVRPTENGTALLVEDGVLELSRTLNDAVLSPDGPPLPFSGEKESLEKVIRMVEEELVFNQRELAGTRVLLREKQGVLKFRSKYLSTKAQEKLKQEIRDADVKLSIQQNEVKNLSVLVENLRNKYNATKTTRSEQAPRLSVVGIAENASSNKTAYLPQKIAPGDQILILVEGEFPDMPIDQSFTVEPAGTVALGPTYGRVVVADMTLTEAEKAVTTHLRKILTDVVVQITWFVRKDVSQLANSVPQEIQTPEYRKQELALELNFMRKQLARNENRLERILVANTKNPGTISAAEIEDTESEKELAEFQVKKLELQLAALSKQADEISESSFRRKGKSTYATSSSEVNRVVTGDELMVRVEGEFPDQPMDDVYRVQPSGALPLGPTYGRVQVAGMTVEEAEAALVDHLAKLVGIKNAVVQITWVNPKRKSTLLYDDKTFEEWRQLWRTELKTEKRTECIKALAAFGRAGRAEEAIEAILDVAGEYNFSNEYTSEDGELKMAIYDQLRRLPTSIWLASLVDRFDADQAKWESLAKYLLSHSPALDKGSRELLISIAKTEHGLRSSAVLTLLNPDYKMELPETVEVTRNILQGHDPDIRVFEMLGYSHLEKVPEQIELLFHKDIEIREKAREILSRINISTLQARNNNQGKSFRSSRSEVIDILISIISDPNQSEKHVEAIRGLSAVAKVCRHLNMAYEITKIKGLLKHIVVEGEEHLLGPTFYAIEAVGDVNLEMRLLNEQGLLTEERSKLTTDQKAINNLIAEEEQKIGTFQLR